ncbi:hypothetical protein CANARDRAFT_7133 [[Candida] arabinofermentans NRRL YB-2248]|uniref:Uncharacterized protein n=1 Tax=[Candida] arabinofermentans NRRL YB-2248 TaxID=983967 RepID=A0A1E4T1W9_9ASCO|nr:hypothetical protein CANARDRAFT_7133 [[Candida] arabinofermentans NRRL YB-2248]
MYLPQDMIPRKPQQSSTTTQTSVSIRPSTPFYSNSIYHLYDSPRSEATDQITPRTVRLINYDNYNYTPSTFSVFPDFEMDKLDVSNNYDLINLQRSVATDVVSSNDKSSANIQQSSTRPTTGLSSYSHSSKVKEQLNPNESNILAPQVIITHTTATTMILRDQEIKPNRKPSPNTRSEEEIMNSAALLTSDPIPEYQSLYESSAGTCLQANSSPTINSLAKRNTVFASKPAAEAPAKQSYFFDLDEFSDFSDDEESHSDIESIVEDPDKHVDLTIQEQQNDGLIFKESSNKEILMKEPTKLLNSKDIEMEGSSNLPEKADYSSKANSDSQRSLRSLPNRKLYFNSLKNISTLKISTKNFQRLNIIGKSATEVQPKRKSLKRSRDDIQTDNEAKKDNTCSKYLSTQNKELDSKDTNERIAPLQFETFLVGENVALHKKIVRIPLEDFSEQRLKGLVEGARTKRLNEQDVEQVLQLFKLRNFDLKLRILAKVLGNAKLSQHEFPCHTSDTGLVLTEDANGKLHILAKTYAGWEDTKSVFKNSIMSFLEDVKDCSIYFRQPNECSSNFNHHKSIYKTKKKDPSNSTKYIKRPLNSFMLYRAAMVKVVIFLSLIGSLSNFVFKKLNLTYQTYDFAKEFKYLTKMESNLTPRIVEELRSHLVIHKFNHHLLIQLVSIMWANETETVKQMFVVLASHEKELHAKCNPEYKYHPKRKA